MENSNNFQYPLTDEDIHNAVLNFDKKGANIKEDSIIKPNLNIESLFSGRGHVILFHKWPNQTIGHWYSIIRDRHNTVFMMDSLGNSLEYYNKNFVPFLRNNGIKNIVQNEKKFQSNDTSVCGRYCLVNCILNKMGLTIDQIYKFYEKEKKKYRTYDKVVFNLTK